MVKTSSTLCVIKHTISTYLIPLALRQQCPLFSLFDPHPPCHVPIAPNLNDLPAEIIDKIINDLVSQAYVEAFAFVYNCPKFVPVPDVTRLREAQANLSTAVRVSRAWYFVATQWLYARPFLPTTQSIRSFERTITTKSDLAHFVKNMVVQDEGKHPPPRFKRQAHWARGPVTYRPSSSGHCPHFTGMLLHRDRHHCPLKATLHLSPRCDFQPIPFLCRRAPPEADNDRS